MPWCSQLAGCALPCPEYARCRCENATERLLEYAATLEPKSKPTDVKKLGARPFTFLLCALRSHPLHGAADLRQSRLCKHPAFQVTVPQLRQFGPL